MRCRGATGSIVAAPATSTQSVASVPLAARRRFVGPSVRSSLGTPWRHEHRFGDNSDDRQGEQRATQHHRIGPDRGVAYDHAQSGQPEHRLGDDRSRRAPRPPCVRCAARRSSTAIATRAPPAGSRLAPTRDTIAACGPEPERHRSERQPRPRPGAGAPRPRRERSSTTARRRATDPGGDGAGARRGAPERDRTRGHGERRALGRTLADDRADIDSADRRVPEITRAASARNATNAIGGGRSR